ncbi:MAG TPA: hypothetical protein VG986_08965 [Pseudolabrys sp.]|nr:hypothetical protein [Pseudolabrys sp.]
MQISVLIGTNRSGLSACARIAQACSWASPDIEVIVRDNSGNADKRELLARMRGEHRNIILAEPCDALTNFSEILRLAQGDFIFLAADDDFLFDHAIAALPPLIEKVGGDPAVAGITGAYLVESGQFGSSIMTYQDAEADDAVTRVAGYLNNGGPNILHYAPVRREVVQSVFAFMNTLPFYFSFHDQVVSLLYLLKGKFARLNRIIYGYDLGPWASPETAQQRDLDYYREAGLDPAINKLHWFLCGFEGALLARNAAGLPDYPLPQRQAIADRWFTAMYHRFRSQPRLAGDSVFAGAADRLCAKLQAPAAQLSFESMLSEICGLIALSSPEQAQRYFDFWAAAIAGRLRAPAVAAAESRVA